MAMIYPRNIVASQFRARLPEGYRARQHALLCDVVLWAVDRRRHGNQDDSMKLFIARLKALVLWDTYCREAAHL